MDFTKTDIEQIKVHGSSPEIVREQLERLREGFGYLPVEAAATAGNGVMAPSDEEAEAYTERYESRKDKLKIVKFVPASGAATRMFRDLFEYRNNRTLTASAAKVIDDIENIAFYERIKTQITEGDAGSIANAVLDYGASLPKALILFHNYNDGSRTALEEHLAEGAMYAASDGRVRLHFTISAEHADGFRDLLDNVLDKYEKKYGVNYTIDFSRQKSRTDTIAVTPDNEPFREPDGSLLFRPAGHGALLENLDSIDADIIFIKNVDNVTPDHLKNDTVKYKKILAGLLLTLQQKVYGYLHSFDDGHGEEKIPEIISFLERELCYTLPDSFYNEEAPGRTAILRSILDRPLRVCGMVKNEGEPGGGPFWTKNRNGSISLQIAEPSQVAPEKERLLKEGTHFNPVDIVCGVKNYKGRKFDLAKYVDHSTGFISEKSKDGKPLKALELPGLWNGSMSDWNTVFVEVPGSTFTPVKEVSDLLRPEHL